MDQSKTNKEPKVEIFGEEIKKSEPEKKEGLGGLFVCRHHQNHGSYIWGLFFISLGIIFLLSNMGALPPLFWSQIIKFWPVIFIFIGLDIMVGRTWISGLLSALLSLFIFATILGVIFLNVAPDFISGLPEYVRQYLGWLNSYIQIK